LAKQNDKSVFDQQVSRITIFCETKAFCDISVISPGLELPKLESLPCDVSSPFFQSLNIVLERLTIQQSKTVITANHTLTVS